jgi:hypothetical protein
VPANFLIINTPESHGPCAAGKYCLLSSPAYWKTR